MSLYLYFHVLLLGTSQGGFGHQASAVYGKDDRWSVWKTAKDLLLLHANIVRTLTYIPICIWYSARGQVPTTSTTTYQQFCILITYT